MCILRTSGLALLMLEVAAALRVFVQRDLSVVIWVKWVFVRLEWTK